jgi:hypothetical protein
VVLDEQVEALAGMAVGDGENLEKHGSPSGRSREGEIENKAV